MCYLQPKDVHILKNHERSCLIVEIDEAAGFDDIHASPCERMKSFVEGSSKRGGGQMNGIFFLNNKKFVFSFNTIVHFVYLTEFYNHYT